MNVIRAHSIALPPADGALALLTLPEVAKILRCSTSHLYRILRGNQAGTPPLPLFHIGRKVFVRHPQLEAWIRSLEDIERDNLYATGNFGLREEEWESIAGA